MLDSTLENIQKRQSYLQDFNQEKISTLQTKQTFCKAQQDFSDLSVQNLGFQKEQKIIFCPKSQNPIESLLKRIQPACQNSYEQIEQIEMQMKLFNSKPLNQIQVLKCVFNQQKEEIKRSCLKVNDFLEIYEGLVEQEKGKECDDDLVRQIRKVFESGQKNLSVDQVLQMIVNGVRYKCDEREVKERRKRIWMIEGIEVEDEQEHQFGNQTRKQMQNTLQLYQHLIAMFDIEHLQ